MSDAERYAQLMQLREDACLLRDWDKLEEIEHDLETEFPDGPPSGEAIKPKP